MRQQLALTYADGTTRTVEALPVDFVRWERKFNRRASDLASGIGMEDLLFLAWAAIHRSGNADLPPFDVWMERVTDVDLDGDDDPKPTPLGASDGS